MGFQRQDASCLPFLLKGRWLGGLYSRFSAYSDVAQIIVCKVEIRLALISPTVSIINSFLVLFPDCSRICYG